MQNKVNERSIKMVCIQYFAKIQYIFLVAFWDFLAMSSSFQLSKQFFWTWKSLDSLFIIITHSHHILLWLQKAEDQKWALFTKPSSKSQIAGNKEATNSWATKHQTWTGVVGQQRQRHHTSARWLLLLRAESHNFPQQDPGAVKAADPSKVGHKREEPHRLTNDLKLVTKEL